MKGLSHALSPLGSKESILIGVGAIILGVWCLVDGYGKRTQLGRLDLEDTAELRIEQITEASDGREETLAGSVAGVAGLIRVPIVEEQFSAYRIGDVIPVHLSMEAGWARTQREVETLLSFVDPGARHLLAASAASCIGVVYLVIGFSGLLADRPVVTWRVLITNYVAELFHYALFVLLGFFVLRSVLDIGLERSRAVGGVAQAKRAELVVSAAVVRHGENGMRRFVLLGQVPGRSEVAEVSVSRPDFLGARIGETLEVIPSNTEGVQYLTPKQLAAASPRFRVGNSVVAWPLQLLVLFVPLSLFLLYLFYLRWTDFKKVLVYVRSLRPSQREAMTWHWVWRL